MKNLFTKFSFWLSRNIKEDAFTLSAFLLFLFNEGINNWGRTASKQATHKRWRGGCNFVIYRTKPQTPLFLTMSARSIMCIISLLCVRCAWAQEEQSQRQTPYVSHTVCAIYLVEWMREYTERVRLDKPCVFVCVDFFPMVNTPPPYPTKHLPSALTPTSPRDNYSFSIISRFNK